MESWFRLYTGICADPKLRRLPVCQRWAWVVVLALAKESPQPGRLLLCEGVPLQPSDLADQANITLREAEEALASFLRQGMVTEDDGIYSVVHWAKRQYLSDRSSERVRHFRQKEAAQVFSPAATVAEMEDTPPIQVCDSPSSAPNETEMKRFSNVTGTQEKRYGSYSVTTKKRFRNVSVTPPEYRVQRTEKDNPSPLNTGGSPRAVEKGADYSSPDSFDDFWQAYPRHLAKEAARKAWRVRLRAGVDPPSLVRCAAAYAEECQRLQTPARFILHPATFLGSPLRYLDCQAPGSQPPLPRLRLSDGSAHNAGPPIRASSSTSSGSAARPARPPQPQPPPVGPKRRVSPFPPEPGSAEPGKGLKGDPWKMTTREEKVSILIGPSLPRKPCLGFLRSPVLPFSRGRVALWSGWSVNREQIGVG